MSVPLSLTATEAGLLDAGDEPESDSEPLIAEGDNTFGSNGDTEEVSSQTVSFFDMPHRTVSNVTVCPAMHLSWHNISAYPEDESTRHRAVVEELGLGQSKDQQEILSNVFGVAQPGEVLAIMGSSGAGKTTLLNILAHRNLKAVRVEGAVKVNGLRVDVDFIRRVAAYVEQEDSIIGSLTVREQMRFYALLRMGRRYSKLEQHKRVEIVMKELGLLPVADTVIATRHRKNLSGGERKRLTFAAEVLTSPPILMCDEPTSGLDSFLALQVVTVLRKLARRKGMTIIITIHQPSSQVFGLFDRIYMMAEGSVAFTGTAQQAEEFWNSMGRHLPLNFNPADHYMRTLAVQDDRSKKEVRRLCDAFTVSSYGRAVEREARTGEARPADDQATEETRSSEECHAVRRRKNSARQERYKSTWWQQLRILTWRMAITIIRDPSILYVQLFQTILVAVMTGAVYAGTQIRQETIMTINGALFQQVTDMNYLFQFSVVHVFCMEVHKFVREHNSNLYRVDTYFLAKNIAEMPTYTFYVVLFSAILYWMAGLVPTFDAFLVFVGISILLLHVAISIAYLCACIFSSLAVAMAVVPVFVIPALAFSGFYLNTDSLPAYFYPLRYVSYFALGYEALAINQWSRIDHIPGCSTLNNSSLTAKCLSTGKEVLESMSFHEDNLQRNVIIMVAMIVIIRILAFLALYLRSRRQ